MSKRSVDGMRFPDSAANRDVRIIRCAFSPGDVSIVFWLVIMALPKFAFCPEFHSRVPQPETHQCHHWATNFACDCVLIGGDRRRYFGGGPTGRYSREDGFHTCEEIAGCNSRRNLKQRQNNGLCHSKLEFKVLRTMSDDAWP